MSAVNIGPQIGLRGVDTYKMDLKTATQATKTFKAELEAVSKIKNPFENATKSQSALDSEINAQKRRVELLGQAYKSAVDKYGVLSMQALKAQEQLAKGQKALAAMVDQYKAISTTTITIPGVGEFKRDLETLTQASKTLKAEFNLSTSGFGIGTAFERASQSSRTLNDAISAQRVVIHELEAEYEKTVREQGEFSKGAMEMREKVANAKTELNNMEKTLRDLPNGLQNVSKEMDELSRKTGDIAKGFERAAKVPMMYTAAYTAAMTPAVKVSMDYEQQMAKVAAVSGFTEDQMAGLNDQLLKMAQDSIYGPVQLAEGLEQIGRAGIKDTNDQISVLNAALDLATAEGRSFDEMADGLISTLYQYGLNMTDAAEAADILAQASRSAKTDVALIYESLGQAAPSMNALNFTLRDTALAIDLMADAGITGSRAGTYLKTSMANLTAPTKKQAETMDEFGISLIDAEGESVSFVGLLDQLRASFGGLDVDLTKINADLDDEEALWNELSGNLPAEQLDKLRGVVDIFGKRSLPAMLAMINASDERFEELKSTMMNTSGVAEQMANIVEDSATGGWQKLKSGLQVLGIEMGNQLLPVITTLLEKGLQFVNWFSSLSDGTKKFLVIGGGLLALVGPLLTGVGGMFRAISDIQGGISGLTGALGGIGKMIGGGGGLISMLGGLGSGVVSLLATIGPALIIGGLIVAAGVLIYKNWDEIKETAGELAAWAKEKWEGIKQSVSESAENMKNKIRGFVDGVKQFVADLKQSVVDKFNGIRDGIYSVGERIKGIVNGVKTALSTAFQNITTGVTNAFNAARTAAENVFTRIRSIGTGIRDAISGVIRNALQWGKDLIGNFVSGIKQKINDVVDAAKGVADTIRGYLHFSVPDVGPLADADQYGPDFMRLLASGMRNSVGMVQQASEQVARAMVPSFYADLPEMSGTTTNMGGVTIVINAQPGQDVEELAEIVEERISNMITRRETAYA